MSEILSEQYSFVFSDPIDRNINADNIFPEQHTTDKPTLNQIKFSDSELAEAMDDLATNAAPGPDWFSAILLKSAVQHFPLPWRRYGENR